VTLIGKAGDDSDFQEPRIAIQTQLLPFLNLPVSEVQETSDWRTHDWNVMSEQRKSNWQHPNTYYREREKTPGNDECDTSQQPAPISHASHEGGSDYGRPR
jgi:hypothetical protein